MSKNENLRQEITLLPSAEDIFPSSEYIPTEEPSFKNVKAFIAEAARSAVHIDLSVESDVPDRFEKGWETVVLYTQTDLTGPEIASQQGVTKQAVGKRLKSTIERLHASSPIPIKEKFKKESFVYRKTGNTSLSLKLSRARGGMLSKVYASATKAQTIDELMALTGISHHQLSSIRSHAVSHGVKIPYLKYSNSNESKERVREANNSNLQYEERKGVIDTLGKTALENSSEIVKISGLLKELGIRFTSIVGLVDFHKSLEERKIPSKLIENEVGKHVQRYAYIFSTDREKVLEFLKEYFNK